MAVSSMVSGRTTKWKAVEFSTGQITEDMKASTLTIRKRGMESSTGPMAASTMVSGLTGSSMASEPTPTTRGLFVRVSGLKASASTGSTIKQRDENVQKTKNENQRKEHVETTLACMNEKPTKRNVAKTRRRDP